MTDAVALGDTVELGDADPGGCEPGGCEPGGIDPGGGETGIGMPLLIVSFTIWPA